MALHAIYSMVQRHDDVAEMPHKDWFQVLTQLFACCKNVETIDIPEDWWHSKLYNTRFPKITAHLAADEFMSPRILQDGRWRFGKDRETNAEAGQAAGAAGEASHSMPQT